MIFAGDCFDQPTFGLWARHSSSELPCITKNYWNSKRPAPLMLNSFGFGFLNGKKFF